MRFRTDITKWLSAVMVGMMTAGLLGCAANQDSTAAPVSAEIQYPTCIGLASKACASWHFSAEQCEKLPVTGVVLGKCLKSDIYRMQPPSKGELQAYRAEGQFNGAQLRLIYSKDFLGPYGAGLYGYNRVSVLADFRSVSVFTNLPLQQKPADRFNLLRYTVDPAGYELFLIDFYIGLQDCKGFFRQGGPTMVGADILRHQSNAAGLLCRSDGRETPMSDLTSLIQKLEFH